MDRERRDALFVINQDASIEDLKNLCCAQSYQSALLLTTHRVFPSESEMLSQVTADVNFISFTDLLEEADMCHCDEIATQQLLDEQSKLVGNYSSQFIAISLKEKNRIAHHRLSALYQFNAVYYLPGLGVVTSYWKNVGKPLSTLIQSSGPETGEKSNNRRELKLVRYAQIIRNLLKPIGREVYRIREDGISYLFFSTLKRLRIRPKTNVETWKLSAQSIRILKLSQLTIPIVKMKKFLSILIRCHFGCDTVLCMTIHDYERVIAESMGNVMVFVDGYHPSNYPRSYIDGFGNDIFVVRTMFDDRWFSTYGKRTTKPPSFLQREYFAPCVIKSARKVLIALNHAGDWTALINRSDTDDLVAATAEMARRLPHILFRIRTHPTMNHPAHEGVHSSDRINLFVRSVKLVNMNISTHNLSEDITWCDVCLSEYSQVLLDAMRIGKLGVAVNLTKRRSFMQDFAALGFFHAQSLDRAVDILQYINSDPSNAAVQQNKAAMSYNKILAKWLGEHL